MEISEKEFHKALLKYFTKLSGEIGNIGWNADNIKRIAKELQDLVKIEEKLKGRENIKVNIRHVFGFKIE